MTTMLPSHAALLLLLVPIALPAQAAGLRGAAQEPALVQRLAPPDAAAAERVITIEAVASLRVVPTQLRLVFAVSAVGEDTSTASAKVRDAVAAVKGKLAATGVAAADVDVDFIAAVPVYEWRVEKQSGRDAVVEKRTGTRVQYNLHVAAPDEAAALVVIEAATAGNGVDLLAVDYWSDDLERQQVAAQDKALEAAQAKAKRLLAAFGAPPKLVNVHEATHVLYPQQLYQSLPHAEDSTGNWYAGDQPRVPASRPLQVYYRGLFADVDRGDRTMPGARHLEVVTTVRLYFAAPDRPEPAK